MTTQDLPAEAEGLRKRLYEMCLPIIDAAITEAVVAERERIIALAEHHDAWVSTEEWFTLGHDIEGNRLDYMRPFADLLRQDGDTP